VGQVFLILGGIQKPRFWWFKPIPIKIIGYIILSKKWRGVIYIIKILEGNYNLLRIGWSWFVIFH